MIKYNFVFITTLLLQPENSCSKYLFTVRNYNNGGSFSSPINSPSPRFKNFPSPLHAGFAHKNPIKAAPTMGSKTETLQPYHKNGNKQIMDDASNVKPTSSGCPSVFTPDGNIADYRRDKATNHCFPVGSKTVCGEVSNMQFYSISNDNLYGKCDCFRKSSRPLIFAPEENACFYLFQQGFCKEGEWLTITPMGKSQCELNPCYEFPEKFLQYNWRENSDEEYLAKGFVPLYKERRCVRLGESCRINATNGHIQVIHGPSVQKIIFRQGDMTPSCGSPSEKSHVNTDKTFEGEDTSYYDSSYDTDCIPGSREYALGLCRNQGSSFYVDKNGNKNTNGFTQSFHNQQNSDVGTAGNGHHFSGWTGNQNCNANVRVSLVAIVVSLLFVVANYNHQYE